MQISSRSRAPLLPSPSSDPLLPWLRSIGKAMEEFRKHPIDPAPLALYSKLLHGCLDEFSCDSCYRDDPRLVEILVLYGDATQDFDKVLAIMESSGIGIRHSVVYETAGLFYLLQGKLLEAQQVYQLGISRSAQPVGKLREIHASLLEHCKKLISTANPPVQKDGKIIDPWSPAAMDKILKQLEPQTMKYNGYYRILRNYSGKVPLSSLQKNSRNKIVEGKKIIR